MSQPIRIRTLCTGKVRSLLPGAVSLAALLGCSGDVVNLGENASPQLAPPSYSRCIDSATLAADVHVSQQSELDELEGCETIEGDLYVQPYFEPDLRPLHELKVVTGMLAFGPLPQTEAAVLSDAEWEGMLSVYDRWLPTFEGLEALESVGSLTISATNAPDLTPLSGLRALTGEGALTVKDWRLGKLRDLAPLGQLRGIRSLYVYGEGLESIADLQVPPTLGSLMLGGKQLTDLGAIRQVRRVDGSVELAGIAVHDLTAFSALESAGAFMVRALPSLESLNGLEQLTDAGEFVNLLENPLLDNIDALTTLRHADGLAMTRNASLQQIPDFPALGLLKSLIIMDNAKLEQIAEFSGILTSMVIGAPFDPLNAIIRRPDVIQIIHNPALRSFSMPVGWEGGKYVEISDNASLKTLEFAEVEDIDLLGIWQNPELQSVDLGALARVDSLVVYDNPALAESTFDGVQTYDRSVTPPASP